MGREGTCTSFGPALPPTHAPTHPGTQGRGRKEALRGAGRDSTCDGEQDEQPERPHGSLPWRRQMQSALCKIPSFP